MKLWQIVEQIYGSYGQRFQIPATRILRNVSAAQRIAFNRDCRAFEKLATLPPLLPALAAENGFVLVTEGSAYSEANPKGKQTAILAEALVSREKVCYTFPKDCRIIKRIFGNPRRWDMSNVYIDDFLREIEVRNPTEDEISVVYYRQPLELTCEGEADMDRVYMQGTAADKEDLFTDDDEDKVILPEEWHFPVLVQLATALCDTENYGDKTPQSIAEQYLMEFWEAMDKRRNDRKVITSVGAW